VASRRPDGEMNGAGDGRRGGASLIV
jgi:hypothetical protein